MIIIPKLNIIKIFMRLRRIYYPFVVNNNKIIIISDEKAHYLRSVLRYQVGQKLHIFNQQQQEFFAEILVIKKKQIELKLLEEVKPIKPSCLDLCLVQSISKGERMDYSVQKATELGVNRIQPIFSEFGDVKLKGERLNKKVNHWQNIAISACEQSFRADIPQILTPISIAEYCSNQKCGIFLQPKQNKTIGTIAQKKWQKLDIAIGPEGGWSQNDLELLQKAKLQGIDFGQRILRTESMAPAILAAIHALWGDFT